MTAQNIFRTTHATNFTVLPNQIWNAGLSVSATAALGYILSKPPTWKIRITDLRNKLRIGRDKVYRTLQELCAAGYARMTRLQRGVRWEFYDTPQIFETSDTTEPTPDSRLPEIQLTEQQEALKKNEIPSLVSNDEQQQATTVTLNDPVEPTAPHVVASDIENIQVEINQHSTNIDETKSLHASFAHDPIKTEPEPIAVTEPETSSGKPSAIPFSSEFCGRGRDIANDSAIENAVGGKLTPDPVIVAEVEKLPVTQTIKPTLIKTLAVLTLIEAKAVLAILSRAIVLNKVQNPVGYAVQLVKASQNGTLTPVTTNHQPTLAERLAKQEADRKREAERGKITNEQWVAMMRARGIDVQI